jgi:uncharacterized protein (TIGR00369 family)
MSTGTNATLPLTVAQVRGLIDEHFPGIDAGGRSIELESVGHMTASCRLLPIERNIRPGGTISGPALFMVADFTIYVALIATLGEPALAAVTSNLNINFLSRPEPRDVIANAQILRLGRRMAFADVRLFSAGHTELLAQATSSYALRLK